MAPAGARITGYKQHRAIVTPRAGSVPAWTWAGGNPEGFVWRQVHASQLGLHWAAAPEIAKRLVAAAIAGPAPAVPYSQAAAQSIGMAQALPAAEPIDNTQPLPAAVPPASPVAQPIPVPMPHGQAMVPVSGSLPIAGSPLRAASARTGGTEPNPDDFEPRDLSDTADITAS
jgi:cobyrinic acid a,c-diamide synthase